MTSTVISVFRRSIISIIAPNLATNRGRFHFLLVERAEKMEMSQVVARAPHCRTSDSIHAIMEFTMIRTEELDAIKRLYERQGQAHAAARKKLGRPLTLAEKILAAHVPACAAPGAAG